jgi:hypothetical protein
VRLALALALLGALVLAPSAHAYKRLSYKFPSRTITYYDATGSRYKNEVTAAAAAWNKSGARVHWVKASKSRARVPIRVNSKIGAAGLGWYFGNGRGLIELQPTLKKGQLTKRAGEGVATQVIVHEMGHVMGLDHVTNVCAIMQPSLGSGCPQPAEVWRFRCRLLEKDDIRGAVALFGGKIGKIGPEYCDRVAPPAAPSNLAVAPSSEEGTAQVTWTTPKGSEIESVRVMRRRDVCPTGPDDPAADLVGQETANPGQAQSTIDYSGFPASGRYCYSVQAFGALQRPGKVATVQYDYTGPVAPGAKPSADFNWQPEDGDGQTIAFFDGSEPADDDGQIVAWRWDFADGQSSSERNPTHRFAPGSYSVTLTVTDDQGRTDFITRTVSVEEPIDGGGEPEAP